MEGVSWAQVTYVKKRPSSIRQAPLPNRGDEAIQTNNSAQSGREPVEAKVSFPSTPWEWLKFVEACSDCNGFEPLSEHILNESLTLIKWIDTSRRAKQPPC